MWSKLELRAGRIESATIFAKARKPAYQLIVNFGEYTRQTSAQLTRLYKPEDLVGRQVMAVCNFPVRLIAGFRSQILVTGLIEPDGVTVHLAQPAAEVPLGSRVIAHGYNGSVEEKAPGEIDWACFEAVHKQVGTLMAKQADSWGIEVGEGRIVSCLAPNCNPPLGSKLLVLLEETAGHVLGWQLPGEFVPVQIDAPEGIPNGTPLL